MSLVAMLTVFAVGACFGALAMGVLTGGRG
jgi:hypothetical protein